MYEHHCQRQLPADAQKLRSAATYIIANQEAVQWGLEGCGFRDVQVSIPHCVTLVWLSAMPVVHQHKLRSAATYIIANQEAVQWGLQGCGFRDAQVSIPHCDNLVWLSAVPSVHQHKLRSAATYIIASQEAVQWGLEGCGFRDAQVSCPPQCDTLVCLSAMPCVHQHKLRSAATYIIANQEAV